MLGGGVPSSLAKDSFSRSLEGGEGRGTCKSVIESTMVLLSYKRRQIPSGMTRIWTG